MASVGRQRRMITKAAEWEVFLDDLQQTLDKFTVPQTEQAEVKANVAAHGLISSPKGAGLCHQDSATYSPVASWTI